LLELSWPVHNQMNKQRQTKRTKPKQGIAPSRTFL
jgi:hypothetical protein